MKQYKNVNELWGAIVNGDMDPSVSDFFVTGASYIYQTTQFPNSINKYHNYYQMCIRDRPQTQARCAGSVLGIR